MAKRKSTQSSSKAKKSVRKSGAKKTVAKKAGTKKSGAKKSVAKKSSARKSSAKTSAKKTSKKKVKAPKKKATTAAKKKADTAKRKPAVGKAKKTATPVKKKTTGAKRVARTPKASELPPLLTGITIGGLEIVPRSKPLPKTKLRAKELRKYKELLLAKRRELLGDVNQLSNEALQSSRPEARGDLSNMPSHMADAGSDNWEQEFTLGLIATERVMLRQIDEALERIRNRTYGVCIATHSMISTERLQAKPWAQYCIEFARLRDSGRVPPGLV